MDFGIKATRSDRRSSRALAGECLRGRRWSCRVEDGDFLLADWSVMAAIFFPSGENRGAFADAGRLGELDGASGLGRELSRVRRGKMQRAGSRRG